MKKARDYFTFGACLAVLLIVFSRTSFTQAQQPARSLVLEGGTLIDGNGGAPVRDSVVIIEGNKISSVSREGQAGAYPANAVIVKADGKYVLPGLFDSQNSYSWYFGEGMLNHGVTSTIDVGTTGETAVPYRDAVFHEKVRGPRGFTGVSRLSVNPNALVNTGLENPLTHTRVPKSAEETRQFVRAWIAAGADYILTYDGALPMDFYKAAFDEANKAGIPVFTRAYGPVLFPKDAALLGAANLPHSAGIGIAVTKDPSKFKQGRDDRNELDRYAEMDDQKARDLIQVLVAHHVALVPTFMINFPGYPKDWPQFTAEAREFFNNPDLLAYYPPAAMQSALRSYTRNDSGEVRERRVKGYQNAMRFHKMFVDAGGHLVVSGNTNDAWVPGVDLHQEMQVMVEAGLTPMQIIMGSTKYPAEMLRKQNLLGTVEAGKLADVIIVNADPLQDIKNLDKINTVIQDGRIIELGYHANYTSPFANAAAQTISIEGLPWAEDMKKATRGAEGGPQAAAEGGSIPDPMNSPQPAIETMNPIIVTQGDSCTVTLTGFNFVRRSAVYFKGHAVAFKAVSPTELQVTLDADALREAGRFDLVVKNPEPLDPFYARSMWGNGTSNIAHLIVNYKY
ncbi:MAG TPA: amidohydrolase family protein [Candidatus Acidoferrales bacterium]